MSEEKQIDEMLNEICTNCTYLLVCEDEHLKQVCRFAKMTKALYDAGYRKQSEGRNLAAPGLFECSECHWMDFDTFLADSAFNFCPNCGAKMKERIEHEQERNASGE